MTRGGNQRLSMLKPKLMTANLFLTSFVMSKTKEVLRLWVESKKCLFRTAIHFLDTFRPALACYTHHTHALSSSFSLLRRLLVKLMLYVMVPMLLAGSP